jgi:hypothetical protein
VGDFHRWLISLIMQKKNSVELDFRPRKSSLFGLSRDGITAGISQPYQPGKQPEQWIAALCLMLRPGGPTHGL